MPYFPETKLSRGENYIIKDIWAIICTPYLSYFPTPFETSLRGRNKSSRGKAHKEVID